MALYLILMVAIFVVAGVLFVYFSSKKQAITTDQILTARGSSPWWQVTLSSIAVLMGAWALFSPQETAMIAGVPGCFAFALGSVIGIFVFGFVGRRIRKYLPNGSSGTEFMRLRYGKLSYYLMTIISLIGMGIMLTSELTGISSAFNALWGIPRWIVIVVVLIGVLIYTTCGGIKASLFVDSIQTAVIIPTFIVLFFYMISHVGGVSAVVSGVQERAPQLLDWGYGYGWQHGGGFALGLFTAIFVDQSYWQRAYAVKDEKNMIKTFTCVGIILLPMLLLAASFGLIAAGTIDVQNQSIVMFELLNAMAPKWLQVIVLFMALALIMSTASGSINGITSILAVETKNLMAAKSHNGTVNGKKVLWIARGIAMCIVLVTCIVALKGISVLYLFTISNMLVTACVFPLFYGMKNRRLKDWGVIAAFICGVIAASFWLPDPTWSKGSTLYCMLAALLVPAVVSVILGAFGKPVEFDHLQDQIIEVD